MDRHERAIRNTATMYRDAPATWATPRSYLNKQAAQFDFMADCFALFGLDLSDPYAPTPGDAVALRGGVLAGERWRPLADGFASAVDAARKATP